MKPRLVRMDRSLPGVDPSRILSLLGASQDDDYTRQLVEDYISRCNVLSEPCGGFVILPAEKRNPVEAVLVNGIRLNTGRIVRKLLGNAENFAFIVATAGPGPEDFSRRLIGEGKFLEGYVADLAGSAIASSVTDLVQRQVMEFAAGIGMKCTNLYTPGYCSWNVDEQQKLFSVLNGGICGVTLNESSLMSPIKSVSGIIGIGREVEFNPDNCKICPRKDCHFRGAHH